MDRIINSISLLGRSKVGDPVPIRCPLAAQRRGDGNSKKSGHPRVARLVHFTAQVVPLTISAVDPSFRRSLPAGAAAPAPAGVAAPAPARVARFSGLGLFDGEGPAAQVLPVQFIDGGLRLGRIRNFDES